MLKNPGPDLINVTHQITLHMVKIALHGRGHEILYWSTN